jgi:tetratricopeptide (TPR) repeat protein
MNRITGWAFFSGLLLLTVVALGCAGPTKQPNDIAASAGEPPSPAPMFEGMGNHKRAVKTSSPKAQQYFDQGLTWTYAFNHDEAIRSYQEAAKLDPQCAMAWWGVALCHGPHINNPVMTPEHSRLAWEALQKAMALRENAQPTERALIDALSHRYVQNAPADRKPLDEAYAAAMGEVSANHRDDLDIATLYAESLMDLQPWDLWTHDGQPKGRTLEIISLLEVVMAKDPRHPGANHLYIHAVEASPHPERAVPASDVLRTAVPASGHLVHMPSHIDIRVGKWQLAADQNKKAIEADAAYRKISPKQGFYSVYMAHNHQFLCFACMMTGQSATALSAAKAVVAGVPAEFKKNQPEFVDPVMTIVDEVLKRFGRWDDLLQEPEPAGNLPISRAMHHFMRGLAYAAKNQLKDAEREQKLFREASGRVPKDAKMSINPAHTILSIADHVLVGEIALRRRQIDDAVRELTEAVRLEDSLLYMEPPEWVTPVRHTLGAVLVSAKRYDEALKVYEADLKVWPENAWSLYGSSQCLRALGKNAEATSFEERFRKVWAQADIQIGSTCLCVEPPRPS